MAKEPTKAQAPKKRTYTVKEGQTVRMGVRISEKEQDELGLPTPKKSITYLGGEEIELTDAEALTMRHALEDAPELTDAEVDQYVEASKRMGAENPDRKAIEEAIKTRQAPAGPDFGKLPRSHEVDLMMAANRRQQAEQKKNPDRKGGEGYREVNPASLAGGAPNQGKAGDPDKA